MCRLHVSQVMCVSRVRVHVCGESTLSQLVVVERGFVYRKLDGKEPRSSSPTSSSLSVGGKVRLKGRGGNRDGVFSGSGGEKEGTRTS